MKGDFVGFGFGFNHSSVDTRFDDALTGILQTEYPTFRRPAFEIVVNRDIHVVLLGLDSQIELSGRFAFLLLTIGKNRFLHEIQFKCVGFVRFV
jgi:hypothetical protein